MAMEAFNPNWVDDEDRWIPKGLMHYLRDNTNANEPALVIDNVNSYSISQIFNTLQNDVLSPLEFRNRLLQQNSNDQQANVNALFTSYNIQ